MSLILTLADADARPPAKRCTLYELGVSHNTCTELSLLETLEILHYRAFLLQLIHSIYMHLPVLSCYVLLK